MDERSDGGVKSSGDVEKTWVPTPDSRIVKGRRVSLMETISLAVVASPDVSDIQINISNDFLQVYSDAEKKMNSEMFEGIAVDRMHLILREMERKGTVGWAMATGSTWGSHYYLVSHRREKPEIALNWCTSEYEDGRHITIRANSI